MAFNGVGVYIPVAAPDFPAIPLTTIRAAQFNTNILDIATALTQCLTRDGQSPATANLPMGGYKHTGAADGSLPGDYTTVRQLAGDSGAASIGVKFSLSGAVLRTALAKFGEVISVKDFGAVGDGVTDDTAAIQAGINAAQSVCGSLLIPFGTFIHTGLTISANLTIVGADKVNSILKMKSGSNTDSITIAKDVLGLHPVIRSLTIEGNRSNNLTAGRGIYLPDSTEPSATVWYGQSVVLYDVYILNTRDECLWVGLNRNMGSIHNTEFKRGGKCVYINGSSDWRFFDGRFAFPQTSHALEVTGGADNIFVSCAMFGATGDTCVKVYTAGSSPTKFIGCTFNANDKTALHIQGFAGTGRSQGHCVIGCFFAENSLSSNGGFPHIKLEDTANTVLIGNCFRYTGSGNKPSYLVQFTGASGVVNWADNSYDTAASAPFTTAVSNTLVNLVSSAQVLRSLGAAYLGGVSGAESLQVGEGVAGGNHIKVLGRASGTSPDLTAQGVDADVGLKLSSKGAANIELYSNGLTTRIARFLYTASAVNYLDLSQSATGQPVQIAANGSDTDVDLRLTGKGAGVLRFGAFTSSGDVACNGYITIKDSGGVSRKLMVTA